MSIIVGALLLPALLIGTWVVTWFVRRSRRWLCYFPAALGVVLLVAAVTVLTPRTACASSSPMMCLDDVSLFGTATVLTGFLTWLALLSITGVVELVRHLAYVSRLRRTTDEGAAGVPAGQLGRGELVDAPSPAAVTLYHLATDE